MGELGSAKSCAMTGLLKDEHERLVRLVAAALAGEAAITDSCSRVGNNAVAGWLLHLLRNL